MASPWIPPQRPAQERPWMGMALLVALPLLSLVLVRMLWSGSSLWFLAAGILFLLGAGVAFLNRRQHGLEYDRRIFDEEPSRWPLVLAALGVLFLALLLLPNFSGGSDDANVTRQPPAAAPAGNVLDSGQAPAEQPQAQDQGAQQPAAPAAPAGDAASGSEETYVVQSGDSLWSIAESHDTTVEAIVEANALVNPAELQVGQELVIPPPSEEAATNP